MTLKTSKQKYGNSRIESFIIWSVENIFSNGEIAQMISNAICIKMRQNASAGEKGLQDSGRCQVGIWATTPRGSIVSAMKDLLFIN